MTVVLSGRAGGTTHQEVELLASLPPELRLIGGLAVMCRVGTPHRTTVDLDAVARDFDRCDEQLRRVALTAPGGGQYRFSGGLDLDVIEIADSGADELLAHLTASGEPISDLELNVVAHTWAHDSATPLDIVAVDDVTGLRLAVAEGRLVATAMGLILMKAMTVRLRASSRPEKRSSDLYDLSRLLVTGRLDASALDDVPPALRSALAERLHEWFVDPSGRDRTYRDIRRFDEPLVDLDDVGDSVEQLLAT